MRVDSSPHSASGTSLPSKVSPSSRPHNASASAVPLGRRREHLTRYTRPSERMNATTACASKSCIEEFFALSFSRRGFLRSLSRTALVLPLEEVLRLARPALGLAGQQTAPQKPAGNTRPSY